MDPIAFPFTELDVAMSRSDWGLGHATYTSFGSALGNLIALRGRLIPRIR
jgi:hypothetical protein